MDSTGRLWAGLLQSRADDAAHQRVLAQQRCARRTICALLDPARIGELTLERFVQDVCRFGHVAYPDGRVLDASLLDEIAPAQLERMITTGELVVVGNRCVEAPMRVCPSVLPGLEEAHVDELRTFLRALLTSGDPVDLVNAAAREQAPLTAVCASLVLCMCREEFAIWTPERVAGLRRLELLVGERGRPAVQDDYRVFCDRAREVRDASGGVLSDLLAVDGLLCHLAQAREARPWKIAIGLTVPEAEAAAVTRQCLDRGFATIAPDDENDPNLARMRAIAPGDYVVMHVRGRIGAIGRVVRPYYEIDRREAAPLDRRWWRRIDVEWIPGDRDYGSLLAGATQRYSVVELDEETFRAIARMYRQSPQFDRLLGERWGSWVLHCPDDRWETLRQLDKRLPLRDRWTVRVDGSLPEPGHRVFLVRGGTQPGVCGIARVISEAERLARGDTTTARLDLLYERLLDPPAAAAQLAHDARTAAWRPPADAALASLRPEQSAAFAEALGLPDERLFLLLADGREGAVLRPQTTYRLAAGAGGQSDQLSAALAQGTVRCLAYHGRPEHAFVGFGTVLAAAPREGVAGKRSLELYLEMCRFPRRAGAAISPGTALPTADQSRRHPGRTRTVLAVSAHDFYRVVGAGMGASTQAPQTASLDELAATCGAPAAQLQEIERLLQERGQMIFYGPPGTGKTWLALLLAHHIVAGDPARMQVVQFHPSYSYEDFIEGIRPRVVEGSCGRSEVTYPVVPGAFKSFCARAGRHPHKLHVFVIDEINRANVSSVFGELMLALEYREREVDLAHSAAEGEGGGRFAVPRNVLVLGTMNTADRSTALVDYALRRRFFFYPFFPDDPLVSGMFHTWLAERAPGMRWVARLLAIINERIEPDLGRHLLIGHTYFMRPNLDEQAVREIWRFQLLPLLEEYFAGMPDRLAEFDIDELIAEALERTQAGVSCAGRASSSPLRDCGGVHEPLAAPSEP